jgi:hypothetical protein
VIVTLQKDGLLRLHRGVTAAQLATALANGARGVNQRLPQVAPKDLANSYRDICRFILFGSAEIAMPSGRKKHLPQAKKAKTKRARA